MTSPLHRRGNVPALGGTSAAERLRRVWQARRMVTEVAVFTAKDGHAEGFLTAYAQAREIIACSPGCRSVRMTRGVENPDRFVLLVEWDTLEAHTEGFRGSERFTQWRALIGPHFESADVQHVIDV